MEILVEVKTIYGNEMIYPANNNAKIFASIAGKKTLSRADINRIKELGYTVGVQPVKI